MSISCSTCCAFSIFCPPGNDCWIKVSMASSCDCPCTCVVGRIATSGVSSSGSCTKYKLTILLNQICLHTHKLIILSTMFLSVLKMSRTESKTSYMLNTIFHYSIIHSSESCNYIFSEILDFYFMIICLPESGCPWEIKARDRRRRRNIV